MNKILMDDLYRYIGDLNKSLILRWRYILFTPGFQYTYCFRRVNIGAQSSITLFFGKYCYADVCFTPVSKYL